MLFGPAHSAPCVKQLYGVSRQRSGQSLSSVGMATYAVGTLLVMEVLEEVDRGAAGMLLFFWICSAIDARMMDLQAAACTILCVAGCYVYMSDQGV